MQVQETDSQGGLLMVNKHIHHPGPDTIQVAASALRLWNFNCVNPSLSLTGGRIHCPAMECAEYRAMLKDQVMMPHTYLAGLHIRLI